VIETSIGLHWNSTVLVGDGQKVGEVVGVVRLDKLRLFERAPGIGELAFKFVGGAHYLFASHGQRLAKCRISDVIRVVNPCSILLRFYPAFEISRHSIEIGYRRFDLRDPTACVFDSCLLQAI
jgi:hypothetical protein